MSEKGKWLAVEAYQQGRTVSSEIKLWSREQLESAYIQRELQLKAALKVIAKLQSTKDVGRMIVEISDLRTERDQALKTIAELRRENAQTNPPGT